MGLCKRSCIPPYVPYMDHMDSFADPIPRHHALATQLVVQHLSYKLHG